MANSDRPLDWHSESVVRAAGFYSARAGLQLASVPAGGRAVVVSDSRSRRSALWMGVFDDRCVVSTNPELARNVDWVIQAVNCFPDLMREDVCGRLLDLCRESCEQPVVIYRGVKLLCCAGDYAPFPNRGIRRLHKEDIPLVMRVFYPDIAADNPDYETEILGGGAAYGCFADAELVALAHTHHPGHMCGYVGDLSVEGTLESHRGVGCGRAVVAATTGEVIRQGRTPVWGMFDDNVVAKRTAASVGFRTFFRLFEVRYRQWGTEQPRACDTVPAHRTRGVGAGDI